MNTITTTPYPRRPSIPTEFTESGLSVDPDIAIPAKISLLHDRQLSLNLKAFLLVLLSTCPKSFSVKDLRTQLEGKIKEDPSRLTTYLKMLRKHGYAKKLYYRTKNTKRIAGALWLFTQERNTFPDDGTLNREMARWGLEILPNSDYSKEIPIHDEKAHSEKNHPGGENDPNTGEPTYGNGNGNNSYACNESGELPIPSTYSEYSIYGKKAHSEKNHPGGENDPNMGSPSTSTSTGTRSITRSSTKSSNTSSKKEKNKNTTTSTTSSTSDAVQNPEKCNLQSSPEPDISQGSDLKNRPITPSMFEEFWSRYPRKVDRGKCLTIWERICNKKPSERPTWGTIIDALEAQKKSERWSNPKFIPHPSTWLNQKRWLDDPNEMKLYHFDEPEEKFPSRRPTNGTRPFGTGWSGYYDQPEIRSKLEGITMRPKF
jgi:hypothetical protein